MKDFAWFSLFALQVSHHVATAAECPVLDDVSMFEDMVNDREDEETFMKFFRLFEGLSVEEAAACKESLVRTKVNQRKLQASSPTFPYPAGHNGTAADFLAPCYSLPANPASDGWLPIGDDDINGDDGYVAIDLDFDFSLYGTTWNRVTAHVNGFLSFGLAPNFLFAARQFPVDINLVAPFWSDVDVRFGGGSVWYKKFPDHLAVVWDRAGRFVDLDGPASGRRNTFQVVISGSTTTSENVCFCYVDMDWWSGATFPARPANVGINNGATREYVQIGRFQGDGTAYDGPGGARDGIDWLDFQGSSMLDPPIQGLCFDVRESSNIPPVATGFPENDVYTVTCDGSLELELTFATPEVDQKITVTDPSNLVELQGLEYDVSSTGGAESVMVSLKWQPQTAGEYSLTFLATDDFTSPASITKTLRIVVATCAGPAPADELPKECAPLSATSCPAGDPQPYCTPHRSPEHCPMDESFTSYLRDRNQIIKSDSGLLSGYWFHYLQDKVASYAFSTAAGYNAPKLYCCTDSVDTFLDTCFPPGDSNNPASFVIRVVGDHHSSSAVYVLPSGFDGPELSRPLTLMTVNQVVANIKFLESPVKKILVEEFISGSATSATLPNEYKVHAFNGEIGAISLILNRGTDCGCYAEVDQDWKRLDAFGCFLPGMPFGKEYGGEYGLGGGTGSGLGRDLCYDIDFETGSYSPFPMKGFDLCGQLPPLEPTCVAQDLLSIAQELSKLVGVAVRIDFFIGPNNQVYIQEYTFNHNGGLRHCAARQRDDGCIDSCFLGRMWKQNGAGGGDALVAGGPVTALPSIFTNWGSQTAAGQCATAQAAISSSSRTSSC